MEEGQRSTFVSAETLPFSHFTKSDFEESLARVIHLKIKNSHGLQAWVTKRKARTIGSLSQSHVQASGILQRLLPNSTEHA